MKDILYIHIYLEMFGFCQRWISLIMECISYTSFSININGESHGYFNASMGIRQDDSLFPYIFIICMESLIRS